MKKLLLILLLIVGCEEPSQHGCLDGQACNYDSTTSFDCNEEWCEGRTTATTSPILNWECYARPSEGWGFSFKDQ